MSLLEKFIQHVSKNQLFSKNDKLIIAASGGLDSTVLCELCKQAGYDFMIAHCNFRLRGKESERDKEFVIGLSEKYQVKVEVKDFDTEAYAAKNKLSIQEAARKLRYEWFNELVASLGFSVENKTKRIFLLTGHHADDNIETLLMNFFRGTGLKGLTGIPAKTGHIRRPLLEFSRDQLMEFAKEKDIVHVEDSSNQDSKYTRNYFRNELIPALARIYPEVKTNLRDNIDRFREIERLYDVAVNEIKSRLIKKKGNELHVPVKQLIGFGNRALVYEIIRDHGFTEKQVDEVIKLCESGSGKYISSNSHRVIRHRHWLIISPLATQAADNIIIEEEAGNLQLATGNIQMEKLPIANSQLPISENVALLDASLIHFPLLLRKWKQGDYFYPLGMNKKKKLARFFIDQKLSRTEKENSWVLEMDRKIIWVVGKRIDERFKVTEKTKEVFKFSFTTN